MEFSDLKTIAIDLMRAMEDHSLTKITLKQGDSELTLEKTAIPMMSAPQMMMSAATSGKSEEAPALVVEPAGRYIKSPVVGTFYTAPAPGEDNFVRLGDRVDEDTVVGVIEAMKVMNEVKAGLKGVVAEILIDNSHPVEFGTHLFRVT